LLVYRRLDLDSPALTSSLDPDPPLSQELRDAVNKDNVQFLKVEG
jgi:hypothetical protein